MKRQYEIKFPPSEVAAMLGQSEAYFDLDDGTGGSRVRFHDYEVIFTHPGLYEQLFHRHLRCASPRTVVGLLEHVLSGLGETFDALRVLDLGAGNGMVGAELISRGVERVVGVDILREARAAAERDRPGVYDAYFVADLANLSPETELELSRFSCNALVSIAALGFGDIPPAVFQKAVSLTTPKAWLAFNLKDSFFSNDDHTGFASLIKRLITDGQIEVFHLERYRHRLSVAGEPLYYYAFICRKR
jgi:predicted TPR repeat methyltransferase